MRISFPIPAAFLLLAGLSFSGVAHAQSAFAGPDQVICGDSTDMQGSFPGVGEIGDWSVLSGTGVFADGSSAATPVTGISVGDNLFIWTVSDGFTSSSDTVLITAYDPNATSDAGPDQVAYFPPAAAILSAIGCTWPCQCHWDTSYYTFADPFDPNTIVSNLMMGTNLIAWVCDNGPCSGGPISDIVIIDLQPGSMSTAQIGATTAPLLFFDPESERVIFTGTTAVHFAVLDMSGRVVPVQHPNYESVDMSGLGAGIYVAQATIGDAMHSLRFAMSR